MPVMRNSQPLGPVQGSSAKINQSGAGGARPDFDKHRSRAKDFSAQPQGGGTTTLNDTSLMQAVFGSMKVLGNTLFESGVEDAYLKGVAQAESGVVESDLQSNWLTRDWTTAGFNDTTARTLLAQSEASLMADMPTLREQDPAAFLQALQARRDALIPKLGQMSQAGRQSILGQIATSDAAAIQRHGQEHAKFIMDQRLTSIQSVVTQQAKLLDNSIGTPAYAAQTASYLTGLAGATYLDPTLPREAQDKMMVEGLEYAISKGHFPAYQAALTTEMQWPDGTTSTAVDRLPLDQQMALGNKFNQAMKALKGQASLDDLAQVAGMKATLKNPDAAQPTYEEVVALAQRSMDNGALSADGAKGLLEDYYSRAFQQESITAAIRGTINGDAEAIVQSGKTEDEASRLTVQKLIREYGYADGINQSLMLYSQGGAGRAGIMKEVGTSLTSAFSQLGKAGAIDDATKQMVEKVLTQVDVMKAQGNKYAVSELLSGMPPEVRDFAQTFIEERRHNGDSVEAAKRAREQVADARSMSPQQKAAIAASQAQENAKLMADVKPLGLVENGWLHIKAMFGSKTAGADVASRTRQANLFTQNEQARNVEFSYYRREMTEALERQSMRNAHQSAEARFEAAQADVASRAIPTEYGIMYMPSGADLQTVFGVDRSDTSNQRIGKGIDQLIRAKGWDKYGDNMVVHMDADGQVNIQRWNDDGINAAESITIPATEVAAELKKLREQEAAEGKRLQGMGASDKSGTVYYDGRNSAGVDPGVALRIRENLVKNEGVRDAVYKDTAGKLTFGVGIAETGDQWIKDLKEGDPVDKDTITRTFMEASNHWIKEAVNYQQAVGLRTPAWTELFAEMGYQSGYISKQKPVAQIVAAAIAKDGAAALAALRKTNAYNASGDERKAHYESLLIKALNLPKDGERPDLLPGVPGL